MFRYLIQDLLQALGHIPFLIVIGICMGLVVGFMNTSRKKCGKEEIPFWKTVCFFSYFALMIMITYLSRESSETIGIDLELGSGLRINDRNKALVLENVLLFIPYGFCYGWWSTKRFLPIRSVVLGAATSIMIESMQLVTGRGIFQLDDIVTNMLGCVIGTIIYQIGRMFWK